MPPPVNLLRIKPTWRLSPDRSFLELCIDDDPWVIEGFGKASNFLQATTLAMSMLQEKVIDLETYHELSDALFTDERLSHIALK